MKACHSLCQRHKVYDYDRNSIAYNVLSCPFIDGCIMCVSLMGGTLFTSKVLLQAYKRPVYSTNPFI
jgi:hypothetical protein